MAAYEGQSGSKDRGDPQVSLADQKIKSRALSQLVAISYFWQRINLRLPVRLHFGFIFSILILFISAENIFAQITGPEQDCDDAIAVCQTVYVQNQSYQGPGQIEDLTSTNWDSGERQPFSISA